MKTFGTIVASILGTVLVAFVVIGVVSAITEGGFFDLFRQWFNIAEEVVETTPDPEVATAVSNRLAALLKQSLQIFKFC